MRSRAEIYHASRTIAATAGLVFGIGVVVLTFSRFNDPAWFLLAFGFLTALGVTMACGECVGWVLSGVARRVSRT